MPLRLCLLALLFPLTTEAAAPPPVVSFPRDIAPILRSRCLRCHSGLRAKAELTLTSRRAMLDGGKNGPALVPGSPARSLLFTHVEDGKMPPRDPLPKHEMALLKRWIATGAVWRGPDLRPVAVASNKKAGLDWWSLQPVKRPVVPGVKNTLRGNNPVDAFIAAKLADKKLSPAPQADRRTLIRRVTFDLTGLPPTPAEIERFLEEKRPGAYERLVDRLLASPAYGERWGRHWLDVVRFAESHGYEMNTLRPNAWPFRDFVVRSFNADLHYPTFVREQLAGDVLGKDTLARAGTGFLVAGPHDMVGNATEEGKRQQRADDLYDLVGSAGATFLGLTTGCARCHDHKFDPITQKDFYALQAVFAGIEHAERPMTGNVSASASLIKALKDRIARLEGQLDGQEPLAEDGKKRSPVNPLRNIERFKPVTAKFIRFTITATNDGTQPCIDELEAYGPDKADNFALASGGVKPSASSVYPNSPIHRLEHLNDGRHGNDRSWISAEAGKGWVMLAFPRAMKFDKIVWGRDREGRFRDRLAKDYRIEVSSDGKTWKIVARSTDRLPLGGKVSPPAGAGALMKRLQEARAELGRTLTPMKVYAGTFRTPDVSYLLKRGDVMQRGDIVPPGTVAAVKPAFVLKKNASESERRKALADWIVHPDNPLAARVIVNRLWHWHMGQGLVRTPSDFGYNGDRPSHPELLDWLADELKQGDWQLKRIHRLIVLSATYRQSSRQTKEGMATDAGNRLLWRMTPRRLEAEALRDALLTVAGTLDRRMGGPGYHLWDYSGYVIVFTPKKQLGADAYRRMLYQFKPRLQQDTTFGAFDCPDATAALPRRNVSTTALQALNLLNDPFILEQAGSFAARVKRDAGSDEGKQVTRAFNLAFGRNPTALEREAGVALVRKHGLVPLCRALVNANEFVFVH